MAVNEYFIRTALWPSIIFTIIVMIAGFLGNVLIIYVYRHHFHRSVPWLFIYVLSVLDLLACVIAMPSELMILSTFASFPSDVWCKISRYLSFTFHGSSCVLLMAIALNRYEKVCRPNNQRLNLKRAKIFCAGTIIFASVSYIPCLFIYGEFVFPLVRIGDDVTILPYDYNMTQLSTTMNVTSRNVFNGTFCTITRESSKALVLGFYFFQFLLYVILVFLIVFFYSRVISMMISYSQKQQLLLSQMTCQARRTDHVRKASKDHRMSIPKDEPTADFSKDFCRNEISADFDKTTSSEHTPPENKIQSRVSPKTTRERDHEHNNITPHVLINGKQPNNTEDAIDIQISPPILEDNDKSVIKFLKLAGSENNINRISTIHSSDDPLETNRLLMRRFKSSDDVKAHTPHPLHILPPVDPYEAMFEPLFLHAPKKHKKKEKSSFRKSKKGRSKSVSRSKSNVDISLRMVKPGAIRNENSKSLEGLATLYCGMNHHNKNNNNNNNHLSSLNAEQDGTLTLTRRTTPKGTKNCIIPISTTLSVKSVVSFNALDPGRQSSNPSTGDNTLDRSKDSNNANNIDNNSSSRCVAVSESKEAIDQLDRVVNENLQHGAEEEEEEEEVVFPETVHYHQHQDNGGPMPRRDTVSFKQDVTVIRQPAGVSVMMRKRSETSSGPANRNSEDILNSTPARMPVDYRRRQSVRPIRANRTSRILFWISLAFVLSFLPFWIIVMVRSFTGPNIMAETTHAELGCMSLFIRFTLISNAINPVIYGLMNSQFRNRCSGMFRRSAKSGTYN